jgi:hypothetical protein
MIQLTQHFSLDEATFSSTAARLGVSNEPNSLQIVNMMTAAEGMEQVRRLIGFAIHIDSWFRSVDLE